MLSADEVRTPSRYDLVGTNTQDGLGGGWPEVLVDNWRVEAVVVPWHLINDAEGKDLIYSALDQGIPIVDDDNNQYTKSDLKRAGVNVKLFSVKASKEVGHGR